MKSGGMMWVCLASGLALSVTVGAASEGTDSPYQDIITRNVFALKPPPPPPAPEETKAPPSKLLLTGIWTVNGKLALLKTAAEPAKAGHPAEPERFYNLHIGERDGDVEVVSIDEKAGSVTVMNAGQQEILTFEKNGVKLASTPAPAVPGAPGALPGALPGVPRPPMGVIPPAMKPSTRMPNLPHFPTRQLRTTSPAGASRGTYSGAGVLPGTTPAYSTHVTTKQSTKPPLTLEESLIMTEVARERTRAQVAAGKLPPLPPNPFLPSGNAQENGATPSDTSSSGAPSGPTLPSLPGMPMFPPGGPR